MVVIQIARNIKYKGVMYPANVNVDVDNADLADLLKRGAWVVETYSPTPEQVSEQPEEPYTAADSEDDMLNEDDNDDTQLEADKDDLVERLREEAEALGIEVKPRWGVPKLTAVIKEATSK